MDNPNERKLIEFLGVIGFSGEKLEHDLRSHIALGIPFFTLSHAISYGNELMRFRLEFKYTGQFSSYQLTEYEAIYRRPVNIRHTVVNDIDTAQLEEQMKKVDWSVPVDPMQMKDLSTWRSYADKVNELCNQLWKLSENNNPEGMIIQDQLRVKYWADTPFDTSSELQELRSNYEERQRFTLTENGFCNVNLAYHILSGKLEDINGRFLDLGINVYSQLENKLNCIPNEFSVSERMSFPEGAVLYSFTVVRDYTGRFNILPYTAALSRYPVINHGVFAGIDTKELERQMEEISWKNSYETFLMKKFWDRDAMYPNVRAIYEQVVTLEAHSEGRRIAQQLKSRYWTDAPFFKDHIVSTGEGNSKASAPVTFPPDMPVGTAYNLLCGRTVCSKFGAGNMNGTSDWYRLVFTDGPEEHSYAPVQIPGYRNKNTLDNLLNMVPVISYPQEKVSAAKEILLSGGILEATLKNGRPVYIMANPQQNTLNIYSKEMKPIPVNLEMDPDWIPEVGIQSRYRIQTIGTL
ncbi:hypothetical protein ACTHGU_16210 [Chitinophagaceae bacterium MMS25-I14]